MIRSQLPIPDFVRRSARVARKAAVGVLVSAGLLVDVFAGFGGGSIASERAHGRPVNIAINHWPKAIEFHERNHPAPTVHFTSDVREIDPLDATDGMPVLHAHFSPDCRHFSSAKGGQPVSDGVRALPWVIVDWAKAVRPTLITMENVKEFLTYGPTAPVMKGGKRQYFPDGSEKRIPIKARAGETFKKWVRAIKALGYRIAWKILDAASYGAPTHRRRLFIVARCDGNDVAWPEPTHGPEGSGLLPYRTAAECIDFSRPCPSIFMTKAQAGAYGKATGVRCNRPLADKTLWRIANGLVRYVIESKKPFIVRCAHGEGDGDTARWGRGSHPADEPLPTLTASKDFATVAPIISKYNGADVFGRRADRPAATITTVEGQGLIAANMVKANHGGPDVRATSVDQPLGAVTTKHGNGVVASHLMKFRGDSTGTPADAPAPTITAGQGATRDAGAAHALGLSSAVLVECANASNTNGARDVQRPAPTVVANVKGGSWAMAQTPVVPFVAGCGGRAGQSAPTAGDAPIGTITAKNDRVLAAAHLTVYHGEQDATARANDLRDPLPTQDTSNRFGLTAAFLSKLRGSGGWKPADAPLDVVCAGAPTFGAVAACLTKFYGTAIGADLLKPLATVTADAGGGHLGTIHAYLSQGVDEVALAGFWRVYAFLIEQIGKHAPLPLVEVDGHLYLIVDVGMRMLEPRELLNAQFTPELAKDYVLPTNKSLAVKLIGNSVSPPVLEALIRAQGISKARKRRAA